MMPVVLALRASNALDSTVATTGQHRQMLDQVFEAFGQQPDIDLDLMRPNQSLSSLTAYVTAEMSNVYERTKPDVVLVHGDTTTAMAAALAAYYAKIKIGHVEAGLRSFDVYNPWPEEFNRIAIDSVATYLFAPTKQSAENLRVERRSDKNIFITGNTGIDAVLQMSKRISSTPLMQSGLDQKYNYLDRRKRLILVTGHRRESFGDGFRQICAGLSSIAARGDCELLYPVHLNPNVREVVQAELGAHQSIHLIEPIEYRDMVYLMQRAEILLTDSGGIQEEGPALGRPVLVMRSVTERPEAVTAGAVRLVGTDPGRIRREIDILLDDTQEYERRARPLFPYGDGTAAKQIVAHLEAGVSQ